MSVGFKALVGATPTNRTSYFGWWGHQPL